MDQQKQQPQQPSPLAPKATDIEKGIETDIDPNLIRIQFWNGHLSPKTGQHIRTKHNPCLWTNVNTEAKPWRLSYKQALSVLQKWSQNQYKDATEFLHHLRYVAYGLGKRDFWDKEVVWWGNMTEGHRPKLVVQEGGRRYTIGFQFVNGEWTAKREEGKAEFYWPL